jgi:hypothetical protein
MATDPTVGDQVRLNAIKDSLDRGGVSVRTAIDVEVTVQPWEQIMRDISGIQQITRAEHLAFT